MSEYWGCIPDIVRQSVLKKMRETYTTLDFYFNDLKAFVVRDSFYILLLSDILLMVNTETGCIERELDLYHFIGQFFSMYEFEEDFIIYGECEILRVSGDFRIQWVFTGRDIFETANEEEVFKIETDGIHLQDWEGWHYHLDFSGHLLKEWQTNTV